VSGRSLLAGLRLLVSLGLLAALWHLVDGPAVAAHLTDLDPPWIMAALALSLPQHLLSAARWRFTAARLGAALGFGRALGDYYLASFLNQVLPGGVGGDVLRAWRHGRRLEEGQGGTLGPAFRAVIFERTAGQAMLLLVVVPGLVYWPWLGRGPASGTGLGLIVAAALAAGLCLYWLARREDKIGRATALFLTDARRALLARAALGPQLLLSGLIVASYIATYFCAAQAIGLTLDPAGALVLAPLVLLAMSLPVSVAGWGLREATAAGLWALAGLPAVEGVAISIAYGILVLVASLPGAAILISGR
jgi:uncharacterized membrane protein YbhN (UPF0104 family)